MTSSKRGDIALVAGGVNASKPRPAIVLQDDLFDATASVTVCPLTTTDAKAPLLRLEIPSDHQTGIDAPSFAMIDKLTTVRRTSMGETIGRLDAVQLVELERRVIVFLGLAH